MKVLPGRVAWRFVPSQLGKKGIGLMANQRKLELIGNEVKKVAYRAANGGKIAVHDKEGEEPMAPPSGTVYTQEATILEDVTTVDGKKIPGLRGLLVVVEIGPKTFLRGRVVTDQKEAEALLMPPFLREFIGQLKKLVQVETVVEGKVTTVVAVMRADGTEVGIPLVDKDTAPPEGASPYPVGESPEEQAEADAKADAEWEEDFDEEDAPDEYGLTKADYDAGATVGICPGCLTVHPLPPGIVGLTDEQAAAERQRRGVATIEADPEWDDDFGDEVPMAELVEEEIGGESSSNS